MPHTSHQRRVPSCQRLALATTIAAAVTVTSASNADVVKNLYYNSDVYNYKLIHMPDLDQRRTTLPADGGMYCVPTSAINIFAYAANHGFPTTNPGPANWQLQSKYLQATLWIYSMGSFMQTDAIDGTDGSGTVAGMDAFLESSPFLKRIQKYRNSNYSPTVAKLTKLGCQGWAMSFMYGKYEEIGTSGDFKILDRVGGHAITLTRSYRAGDTRILRYRDPADDDLDLTTQSTFVNKERDPYEYTAYFGTADIEHLATMTVIFSSGGKRRIIDTFTGIRPMYGIKFANTGDATGGGSVELLDPIGFEGSVSSSLPSIAISPFLDVLDFDFDADYENALVIAKSNVIALPPRLRTLDLESGELVILTNAPSGLLKLATSRHGHIYSFDGPGKLYDLSADGTILHATSAVPQPTDVAVDNANDVLWVLSVPDRTLVKKSLDLGKTLQTIVVPLSVPMSGDGSVIIDPTTGKPWFLTAATNKFYNVTPSPAAPIVTTFTSSALTGVTSLSFGDAGELFITSNGTIKVLKKARNGLWEPDVAHPFNGLSGGSRLAMLRSSSNFDPAEHSGPGWNNILPSQLQDDAPIVDDCLSDFNADEVVDANDLALLLGAWGSGNPVLDIDENGTVGASDLALLLGAWGPCGG